MYSCRILEIIVARGQKSIELKVNAEQIKHEVTSILIYKEKSGGRFELIDGSCKTGQNIAYSPGVSIPGCAKTSDKNQFGEPKTQDIGFYLVVGKGVLEPDFLLEQVRAGRANAQSAAQKSSAYVTVSAPGTEDYHMMSPPDPY